MFEIEGSLRTWATARIDRFDKLIELDCQLLADHRVAYLDYEGELSGGRGSVRRILSGTITVIEDGRDRFVAQLSWQQLSGQRLGFVVCQRIMVESESSWDDIRADWSLLFSPGRYETN